MLPLCFLVAGLATTDPLPDGTLRRLGSSRFVLGEHGPVALSPDGQLLAVARLKGIVTLHDTSTGQRVAVLKPPGDVEPENHAKLIFCDNGKSLAVAHGVPGRLDLWSVAERRCLTSWTLPIDPEKIEESLKHLEVRCVENTAIIKLDNEFYVATGAKLNRLPKELQIENADNLYFDIHPNGRSIAVNAWISNSDKTREFRKQIRIFDTATWKLLNTYTTIHQVNGVDFLNDKELLVSHTYNGKGQWIFNIDTRQERQITEDNTNYKHLSPDKKQFVWRDNYYGGIYRYLLDDLRTERLRLPFNSGETHFGFRSNGNIRVVSQLGKGFHVHDWLARPSTEIVLVSKRPINQLSPVIAIGYAKDGKSLRLLRHMVDTADRLQFQILHDQIGLKEHEISILPKGRFRSSDEALSFVEMESDKDERSVCLLNHPELPVYELPKNFRNRVQTNGFWDWEVDVDHAQADIIDLGTGQQRNQFTYDELQTFDSDGHWYLSTHNTLALATTPTPNHRCAVGYSTAKPANSGTVSD
jgi:hypothetical protein